MDAIRHDGRAANRHGVSLRSYTGALEYANGEWALRGYSRNREIQEWDEGRAMWWASRILKDDYEPDKDWLAGAWCKHEDPDGTFWLPIRASGPTAASPGEPPPRAIMRETVDLMLGVLQVEVPACGTTPDGDTPVYLMTPLGFVPLQPDAVDGLISALKRSREAIEYHNR